MKVQAGVPAVESIYCSLCAYFSIDNILYWYPTQWYMYVWYTLNQKMAKDYE